MTEYQTCSRRRVVLDPMAGSRTVSGRYTKRTASGHGSRLSSRSGAGRRSPLSWADSGASACGQAVGRAGRASLSASSARPTSWPCRCPTDALMLLVDWVGKKSDRATGGIIGSGAPTRPLAPRGVRYAQGAGVEFLPDLPSATGMRSNAARCCGAGCAGNTRSALRAQREA